MSRIKLVLFALVVACLSLGIAACGDDEGSDSGGSSGGGGETSLDLTIGDIVPLTGDLADFGPPGRKAADLALKQIRQAIKKDGLKQTVTLKHADEETDPQASVSAARKLVSADKATCLTGAY